MSTITSKYRSDNTKLFLETFNTDTYYTFVSTIESNVVYSNSEFSKNQFLEKTLFGKEITTADVFYLIQNNRWQYNFIYDQYDDQVDLSANNNFYVVVYPADNNMGDYRIYKCLYNNYNAPSTTAPSYNSNTIDQIYRTADGYVWKYMYNISVNDYNAYNAPGYVPIISNTTPVSSNTSSVDIILVENPSTNFGYETVSGSLISSGITSTSIVINGSNLKEITDYYVGQSIYITGGSNNASKLYKIASYSYDVGTMLATLVLTNQDSFLSSAYTYTYSIFPTIEITGDGTGAEAIPVFSATQANNIESILVLNPGSGYTSVAANIVDPNYIFNSANVNNVRATLRPILSPKGGHGNNIQEELLSKNLLLFSGITQADNLSLPTSNNYSALGLVKNPQFNTSNTTLFDNRIKLTLVSNPLSVGETVTQTTNGITSFSAIVHEVSGNDVYLAEYMGPYPNGASNTSYSDISLNPVLPIVSSQNQLINIATDINNNKLITRSPYIQRSGDVYYMANFAYITRTPTMNEQLKIILQF